MPRDALQPDLNELRRLSRQRHLHPSAALLHSLGPQLHRHPREFKFQYTVNAGTAVTAPALRLLTRLPNSFVTRTHQIPVALNPGAITYEVRYARGGVTGPDGAITGPSADSFLNRTTGLADFRFDKPGTWLIVARAKSGIFFTPWSAPVSVRAIAPFDLERTSFPTPADRATSCAPRFVSASRAAR